MASVGEEGAVPDEATLLEALEESVQEVFESIVLGFERAVVRQEGGLRVEPTRLRPGKLDLGVRVAFHGQLSGEVVLRCTADGAMDIGRGLLMLERGEALDVEEVSDALGECANMIAGLLKAKVLDPVGEYRLGLPEHGLDGASAAPRDGRLLYRLTEGITSVEVWRRG